VLWAILMAFSLISVQLPMFNKVVPILLIAFCFSLKTSAQLIVNEVSQGTVSKEYIEFLVTGTPSCTNSCVDLRGWIIDDNNGWHASGSGVGIAAGCMRFANISLWSCVKIGTIIVVYNQNDINPALPPDDLIDTDNNCRFIIPHTSNLFETDTVAPNTSSSSYAGFTPMGTTLWTKIMGMRNAGDAVHTVSPSNLNSAYFSLSWGDNINSNIYFTGAASNLVYYFSNSVDNNPFNQQNWVAGTVGTADETPGAPNNAANAAWITSMNNNCQPVSTIVGVVSGNTVICSGQSTTLTASGGTNYVWSTGATTSAISVSPLNNTNYSVTVSSSSGCPDTVNVTVTVNSLPVANAGNDTSVCVGNSIILTATGGTTYLWSNGATTASANVQPTANTYYTVTVSNGTCSNTDSVLVSVNSKPNISLGNDITICSGDITTLTAIGGQQYIWSTGATTNSIQVSPVTTADYAVTGTGSNGCSAADTIRINVSNNLVAQINGDTEICIGESTQLTVVGGSIFLWSNGATSSSVNVSPVVNTSYAVTVSSSSGCADTVAVTVNVNALPVADAGADDTICNGAAATLTASGGTVYAWSNGATSATINVQPSVTTTYTVTVSNSFGCSATDSATVFVEPLQLTVTFNTEDEKCFQANDGSVITTINPSGNYTFTFSLNNNIIAANNTGSLQNLQPGNYAVAIANTAGCTRTETFSILAAPEPMLNADVTEPACIGNADATISITDNLLNPQYSLDNVTFQTSSQFTGLAAGNYTVYVVDSFNCSYTVSATIANPDSVTVTVPAEVILIKGESENITISISSNDYTVSISPSNGLSCTDCLTPVVSGIEETTVYTVTFSNGSCEIVKTFTVKVIEKEIIAFPSAFTPDGDGLNDIFRPSYKGNIGNYELNVFNRWGELIYTSNKPSFGWDGTYKGEKQPIETYLWFCKYSNYLNESKLQKGSVTLIR
jgi:gliding motility-associated-like protein